MNRTSRLIKDEYAAMEGTVLGQYCLIYDEGGHTHEQADYICRAVTAHDALVDALLEARRHLVAPEGSTHAKPSPDSPLGRVDAALRLAGMEV